MGMTNREKRGMIIRDFERFVQEYSVEYTDYNEEVLKGVLALLKAQEPRILTVSEIGALANGDVVWVEFTDGRLLPMMVEDGCLMRWRFLWRICEDAFHDDDYKARAWTSRPDQATREAVPWE